MHNLILPYSRKLTIDKIKNHEIKKKEINGNTNKDLLNGIGLLRMGSTQLQTASISINTEVK